jgi:hypothetical protein
MFPSINPDKASLLICFHHSGIWFMLVLIPTDPYFSPHGDCACGDVPHFQ